MSRIALFLCLALAACHASPKRVEDVARTESARMVQATKKLSTFAEYELAPMVLAPAVKEDAKKVAGAADMESRIKTRVEPLLAQWRAAPKDGRSGTLVIEPQLAGFRVISGGARFWAGGMAGDSAIDLDVVLSEKGAAQPMTRARIALGANAAAGGWSVGASDRNLVEYVVATFEQYLKDNY